MRDPIKQARFEEAVRVLSPHPLTVVQYEPAEHARAHHCFDNVREHVRQHGGSAQYGWCFCAQWQDDFVVATSHAVWRDLDGNLVDITPHPGSLTKVACPPLWDDRGLLIFLPHDGAYGPNRFLPLTKNPEVARKCRLENRRQLKRWNEGR
jgi:hypothetical protein